MCEKPNLRVFADRLHDLMKEPRSRVVLGLLYSRLFDLQMSPAQLPSLSLYEAALKWRWSRRRVVYRMPPSQQHTSSL